MERPHAALVAAGGVAGASARWVVLQLADDAGWAVAGVNAAGGLLLAMIVLGSLAGSTNRRLLVGVGFCGAFTTFSTVAVEIARDLDERAFGAASLTAIGGLTLGLIATAVGAAVRRRSP